MSSPEGGKAERCDRQSCYSHMFKWGEVLLSLDADFTAHFYLFIYFCLHMHKISLLKKEHFHCLNKMVM